MSEALKTDKELEKLKVYEEKKRKREWKKGKNEFFLRGELSDSHLTMSHYTELYRSIPHLSLEIEPSNVQ